MELYNTEITIYEVGLSQALDIFSSQHNRRFECLCACLNATKSLLDAFFSIPPAQLFGSSASLYINLAHCFVCLTRLAVFDHPEWDRSLVQENLNISLVLDNVERHLSRVKEEACLDIYDSPGTDAFTTMASAIGAVRTRWEATIASATNALGAASRGDINSFPIEFLEDDWFRDIIGL